MNTPTIIIEGGFKEDFVRSALLEIYLRDEMPGSVEYIAFIDKPEQFDKVLKYIPQIARKKIADIYFAAPTSLSLTYKNFDIIIVSVTSPEEGYLKTNRKALSGLLFHELMHLKQRRRGLDTKIENDGKKELDKIATKMLKLDYPKEELENMLIEVFDSTVHTLKEIYDNMELVQLGIGEFPLEDHINLYKKKAFPYFYESIKKAKQNNQIDQIKKAFLYELNLMAAVIPFSKLAEKGNIDARKFIKHMRDYYESAIYEISGEFSGLITYSLTNFSWSPSFRRSFFRRIFNLCYDLMKK